MRADRRADGIPAPVSIRSGCSDFPCTRVPVLCLLVTVTLAGKQAPLTDTSS
jgi:hypothetical protein